MSGRALMIVLALLASACGGARASLPSPRQPLVRTPDSSARVAPAPTRFAPLVVPPVHRERLANGLTLEVVERRELPLVAIVVASYGLHPYDPSVAPGVASMTARVIERELARMAGQSRGRELPPPMVSLTSDGLLIATQVPSSEVATALTQIAASMRSDACFPGDVELARIAHRELAVEANRVSRIADRAADAALYGADDRRTVPSYGSAEAIEGIQPVHCAALRSSRWTPATTTVALVGDLSVSDAQTHVQGTLGAWARTEPNVPRLPPPAFPGMVQNVMLVPARTAEGSVMILERGPGPRDPGFAAWGVLSRLLGEMFTAELNLEIRERRGWAYGVSAEHAVAADHSTIRIGCTVPAERLADTLAAFDAELARLRRPERIRPEELATAIRLERAELIHRTETRLGIAISIGMGFLRGQPLEHLATLDAELAALRPADVAQAAAAFRIDAAPVVLIGPSDVGSALARTRPGHYTMINPR